MEKEIERIMEEINDWSREDMEELSSQIDIMVEAIKEDERR